MKKYLRYIPALFAIMAFCLLAGCTPNYDLKIHYDIQNHPDTFIDILIPISEDDEDYADKPQSYGWQSRFGVAPDDEEKTSQLYETELFLYNEDGFRSVMLHYGQLESSDSIANLIYSFHDEGALNDMCEKYRVFKVALVSKNGDILQVSEEMPLRSSKDHHLDKDTSYNAAENKVTPKYSTTYATPDIVSLCVLFATLNLFLLIIGGVVCLLISLVRLVIRKPKKSNNYGSNAISFGILTIPGAIAAFYYLYDSFRSTLTLSEGMESLLMQLPVSFLYLIPSIFAVFYAVLYFSDKKKRNAAPAVIGTTADDPMTEETSAPVIEMSDDIIDEEQLQ